MMLGYIQKNGKVGSIRHMKFCGLATEAPKKFVFLLLMLFGNSGQNCGVKH